ncbi:ABC-2 family transporter protein [Fructilactobacillus cliffordii]|uniref:ABC-2 family transporter protein n=1 Tax=Fructilactobacillus cliffordii TaxID=2940299 RepID=A0A9Q8ZNR1_9LACO|nr:ABC-2 family transporter protein [Fructilactobacillus cliffordii]USS88795.1 ABC-2 family transporter protein [Fructilactobacillus cliffordii]
MKYISNLFLGFQNSLVYRANFLISLVTRLLQVGLSLLMWRALYLESWQTTIHGYSQTHMMQYLILTGLLSLIFTFEPLFRLARQIKTGKISTLLLRPINLNLESLSNFVGAKLILIGLLGVLTVVLTSGQGFSTILILLYALVSVALWHQIMFLLGTLAFWLVQMWPLRPVISALYLFCGGLLFPLDVLPTWAYQGLRFSPLALVSSDLVQTVLQESRQPQLLFLYLGLSIVWLIALVGISRWLFRVGLHKFEGVGV